MLAKGANPTALEIELLSYPRTKVLNTQQSQKLPHAGTLMSERQSQPGGIYARKKLSGHVYILLRLGASQLHLAVSAVLFFFLNA